MDDNEDDQILFQMAWEKSAMPLDLQLVCDGEKAIEYLGGLGNYGDREHFPMPDIILLDLKMPRKNGFDVLDWMNRELPADHAPVAVFTSSQNTADIQRAYERGARWFLIKPVEFTELMQWIQLIGQWFQNPQENDLSSSLHYQGPSPRQKR